ncbi:hypothetical protein L9F63_021091, partial [Diploptera punctata]
GTHTILNDAITTMRAVFQLCLYSWIKMYIGTRSFKLVEGSAKSGIIVEIIQLQSYLDPVCRDFIHSNRDQTDGKSDHSISYEIITADFIQVKIVNICVYVHELTMKSEVFLTIRPIIGDINKGRTVRVNMIVEQKAQFSYLQMLKENTKFHGFHGNTVVLLRKSP